MTTTILLASVPRQRAVIDMAFIGIEEGGAQERRSSGWKPGPDA
jgi:hypothetical protein